MRGTNLVSMAEKYRIAVVGSDELKALVNGTSFVGVSHAAGKANARFLGPALIITVRGRDASDVVTLDEGARVNFPLPVGNARESDYRVVHLVPAGKSRAWIEQPDAEYGSYGTSVTVPARETGIYALVHVAELGELDKDAVRPR